MSKSFESTHGDSMYYKKYKKCPTCQKTLHRNKFLTQEVKDGESKYTSKTICNDCREQCQKNWGSIKWNKRGENAEDVTRPSIIDLMESYREGV